MNLHSTFLLVLGLAAIVPAQSPTVASTSPARNTRMGPYDPIRVTFASPISPATATAASVSVFGRWTGAVAGTIAVSPSGLDLTFQPLRPLLVGDCVTVSLARTITAPGGAALQDGYHFQAWVASAPGSGVFAPTQTFLFRQPSEGAISTYGIHAGDVDRDGVPDITAINEYSHDLRVFRSDGCGGYAPMQQVNDGLNWPSPHESADFNRDGWLDLVTGDYLFGNVSVFLNNGAGGYLPPLSLTGNTYIRSVGAADFDGDGYPDLVAGNGTRTLVWINNGNGGFLAPVPYSFQGSSELCVFDANSDGYFDIVGCDLQPSDLWVLLGNGDGTFTPGAASVPIGAEPFQSASGDLNGDGHADMVFACQNPDQMRWYLGDGLGNFTFGGSVPCGLFVTSVHLGDLEGDGDLDAVLSHFQSSDYWIFFNTGAAAFSAPVILPSPGAAACTTLADFDRDGDLDILGADEVVDIGILYSQVGPSLPGLQPPSCNAGLRLNQRADGAGFGARPPVPVRQSGRLAVTMSGQPNQLVALIAGYPAPVSFPLLGWGLAAIDPGLPFLVVAANLLDANGEFVVPLAFPFAPIGAGLLLQTLTFQPVGETLSNPMQFVLVP